MICYVCWSSNVVNRVFSIGNLFGLILLVQPLLIEFVNGPCEGSFLYLELIFVGLGVVTLFVIFGIYFYWFRFVEEDRYRGLSEQQQSIGKKNQSLEMSSEDL